MIKKIFWTGLKAFMPIALTLVIVIWIFNSIETFFGKIVRHVVPPEYYFSGLGIIVGVIFIFCIGMIVNAWLLKKIYVAFDKIVKRIPFIKIIYNSIQELLEFFDKSEQMSQQAVLVETPMGKMIGVITRESTQDWPLPPEAIDSVLVYIPLSYMVGGISMIIPRTQVIPLDWPTEKVMSFALTAGMTGK